MGQKKKLKRARERRKRELDYDAAKSWSAGKHPTIYRKPGRGELTEKDRKYLACTQ